MIGLYPYSQITRRGTPELARASLVTYQRRLWADQPEGIDLARYDFAGPYAGMMMPALARLGKGDWAYAILKEKLRRQTFDNLFSNHCGAGLATLNETGAMAAGTAEMLLQSHAGEIELLPALPQAWPTGSVKGLRARGGFEVDIAWKEGQLTTATIRSVGGTQWKVRYGEQVKELQFSADEPRRIEFDLAGHK